MSPIQKIMAQTEHRPFPFPKGKWRYYQEWNEALFLHWEVPFEILRKLIPNPFKIDVFKGKAYVSLVAFTMQKIRPKYLPAVKWISDFDEINIRTYINNDGKPGVYFMTIEASKFFSAYVAKSFSGLPYEKAEMFRGKEEYVSSNLTKNFFFQTKFKVREVKQPKSDLDRWLTERYCLYLDRKNEYWSYDIHHLEWEIRNVELQNLEVHYQIGDLELTGMPSVCHYSKGVKVLAWPRKKIADDPF